MNIKLVITFLIIILFIAVIGTVIMVLSNKNSKPSFVPPVIFDQLKNIGITSKKLTIISTNPEDNSENNPLTLAIEFKFNQQPDLSKINIEVKPSFDYSRKLIDNILFITPSTKLLPNTDYQIIVGSSILDKTSVLSFKTGISDPTDTSVSPEFVKHQDDQLRNESPSFFLLNKTPHKETGFSIEKSHLKDSPSSHYSFVVVMDNNIQFAQNPVKVWLRSLELTEDQINQLDITYLTKTQWDKVLSFKKNAPFYNDASTLLYNLSSDSIRVTVDKNNKTTGESELNTYLNQNGIENIDWLNNLELVYN